MRPRAGSPSRAARLLVGAALLLAGVAARGTASAAPPDGETRAGRPDDEGSIYLVLRLGERRLYVRRGGADAAIESFRVAIGRAEYETPTGRFRVTEKIVHPDFVKFDWNDPAAELGRVPPGPDNPLGERWIGFTQAYGWTIGFHGTPNPELLGKAVSHGCVRMRNEDVVELYDRVQVGTPVIVEQ
jgi:lipoprotein-anchoring transpeptidase ErfK/SrfK